MTQMHKCDAQNGTICNLLLINKYCLVSCQDARHSTGLPNYTTEGNISPTKKSTLLRKELVSTEYSIRAALIAAP